MATIVAVSLSGVIAHGQPADAVESEPTDLRPIAERPLTHEELLAIRGERERFATWGATTLVAETVLERGRPLRAGDEWSGEGPAFGALPRADAHPGDPLVLASKAVSAQYPPDGSPVTGLLAISDSRTDALRLQGTVEMPVGTYLTPIEPSAIAAADALPVGALVVARGWLSSLPPSGACPDVPDALDPNDTGGRDSAFVRCPGGWLTADEVTEVDPDDPTEASPASGVEGAMAIPVGSADPVVPPATAGPPPRSSYVWQQAQSSDGSTLSFQDIVATDEGFVALGWRQGSTRRGDDVVAPTWRSDDGATWHPAVAIPLPGGARASRLAVLDGELYAIGMDRTHLAVWRALGNGPWHRLKDRASFAANPPGTGRRFGADVRDVVAGHGRIVVSGDYWTLAADPGVEPVLWTSTDGRRWRRSYETLPPPDNGINDLAVTPSGFIGLVGTNQPTDCTNGSESSLVLSSTDGRSWGRTTRRAFGCGVRAVTYDAGSGRYYALAQAPDVDDAIAIVLASDDLRTWSEVYRPPSAWDGQPWSPSASGIDSTGGHVVVVGDARWGGDRDGTTVWAVVSTDADTWQLTADWPQGDGRLGGVEGRTMDESRLVVDAGVGVWYADLVDLGRDAFELSEIDPPSQEMSGVTHLVGAVASLPALLWPDAPAPESIADFVPPAREQLWAQATDGLRLPLHLRFLEARCSSDGGVALVFQEIGRPSFGRTYAYSVRGSMPTLMDDGWGGGTGLSSVLDDPEFIHLMGSDTVACSSASE